MEQFDVLVVGSGSGMLIVSAAVEQGFKTALVENNKMGGTCINTGCVPSKMLLYPADVLTSLEENTKIGIKIDLKPVDFDNIMNRMRALTQHDSKHLTSSVEITPGLTWFKDRGEFISDYTLQTGNHTISAKLIFIASGAQTIIPQIKGLQSINYFTNDTVLQLQTQPKSILIVGGGYIGIEYAHFFSAIGTQTTLIQRSDRILPEEEPEVSALLLKEVSKRINIHTGCEALEVREENQSIILTTQNRIDDSKKEFTAQALMIATGRNSNAYQLNPQKTGINLDEHGFIAVNEYLETSKKNIYSFGDAIGRQMFKHAANYEAGIVWHNATHDHKVAMDFNVVPRGSFTHPQVAAVGLKEQEAKRYYNILVGIAAYRDTAMGAAMGFPEGFVKVIVEKETSKILGAHIIGPQATVLIQEITNAMTSGNGDYSPIAHGMHIHPALNEVVQNAFINLQEHNQSS
ncbi:MAG: dihydrolipoyl dehydrogenase [Nitrososphaerota archaeon]|jgi:dihydrolipoamide dehydrogenase|nr:dihydrolipoyl dehydrogenase [Nitrososphaerota archaeon]